MRLNSIQFNSIILSQNVGILIIECCPHKQTHKHYMYYTIEVACERMYRWISNGLCYTRIWNSLNLYFLFHFCVRIRLHMIVDQNCFLLVISCDCVTMCRMICLSRIHRTISYFGAFRQNGMRKKPPKHLLFFHYLLVFVYLFVFLDLYWLFSAQCVNVSYTITHTHYIIYS